MADPGDAVIALRAQQSRWMAQIAARGSAGEAALHALFKAYDQRTVRRLMGRYGLSQDEAEDVWQDGLLDVWKGAEGFRPGTDLAPWLNTLVNNRALKLLDSAWHKHRSSLHDDDGAVSDATDAQAGADTAGDAPSRAVGAVHAGPGDAATRPRNLDADSCTDDGLARFEQQHPLDARWLFARDLEGRDVPSLAAEMGCSEGAARQRLRLLRAKLRPFLQHCVELLTHS